MTTTSSTELDEAASKLGETLRCERCVCWGEHHGMGVEGQEHGVIYEPPADLVAAKRVLEQFERYDRHKKAMEEMTDGTPGYQRTE